MNIATYAQELEDPSAGLAQCFSAVERELADGGADVVALGGDGDIALVAAISALKLALPTVRLEPRSARSAADSAPGSNARLIELLVPDSVEVFDPADAASEIAAWLESLPTLPAR